MANSESCKYFGVCGGCPWGGRGHSQQLQEKIASVQALFPSAYFTYMPTSRVRDRADLVWENVGGQMRLGLYGLNGNETVDLDECMMMSYQLEMLFKEFRKVPPPIKKGSVRLRVSPEKEWGVWLDFANEDVKTLFESKQYLREISEIAFVEIGQRRKALDWKDGQPKLVDPILKPWFETYDAHMNPIPLYGPVGGFTQPGFESNRALIKAVTAAVDSVRLRYWTELFCGDGNFTLALAARGFEVEALEMDELALEGLRTSLSSQPEWAEHVFIQQTDIYLKAGKLPKVDGKGLLVDPPRAGLREVLDQLSRGSLPKAIVYVSCFSESFFADAARLKVFGYRLKSLVGVDQFPNSPHAEWVALFTF